MKTNRLQRTTRSGFSLAEMMVVIVIIGLLATLVVPQVMGRLFQSKREVAKANIVQFANSIEEYRRDNNSWPESLDDLCEEDMNGFRYQRQTEIPADPWGNPYFYEPPTSGQDPILICYGADGEEGGEQDGRDITYEAILAGED